MLCGEQTTAVTVAAPAKLNLFLNVLGKRSDGYHELETLMVAVGLYDTLRLTADPEGDLRLTCHDAGSVSRYGTLRQLPPANSENLVMRAAELLRLSAGTRQGA